MLEGWNVMHGGVGGEERDVMEETNVNGKRKTGGEETDRRGESCEGRTCRSK